MNLSKVFTKAIITSPERQQEADSDFSIVKLVQAGDVAAFDKLILKYRERVFGVVYNLTANREDASDLTQDSFIKAFQSINRFQGHCSFFTWLYKIAVNSTLSHLRKNRLRSFFSLEQLQEDGANVQILEQLTDKKGADYDTYARELQEKLNEALQKLSIPHRTVITLFEIDGLSHFEIAEIMGCSEGTVRSRLHYAKQFLQGELGKYLSLLTIAMPDSDQRPKVTVEDLLRLKRAERPAAEFWTNFERELRQKQLTALLRRRPWWQELPQFLARRAYLPVGAAAILTFVLVSLKYYSPAQLAEAAGGPADPAFAVSHEPGTPATLVSVPVASPVVNHNEPAAATPGLADHTVVVAAVESQPSADTFELFAPREDEKPSARSIAANLKHLEQSEPELVNAVLGSRLSSPARVQASSAPVVELASLSTGLSRRDRLLAHFNDRPLNPEPTAPEIVRERLSRRLGDAELIERFNRIGLKGDQVSLGLTLRL